MSTNILSKMVEEICETLDCSQRVVASLIDVHPHTLSNNRNVPIDEMRPDTAQKISQLHRVIVTYGRYGKDLRREAILEIIQAHVFQDLDNEHIMDSVQSSIQQGKYEMETLIYIAEIAYNRYQDRNKERYQKSHPEKLRAAV